ncbi:YceI family protein [Kineococcus terrestris]|uniref:YceI family protein n=1 Tax=Kineococcus terrestris TaxID=2044856 RepID=UPI0034DB7462
MSWFSRSKSSAPADGATGTAVLERTAPALPAVPGWRAGTWTIDASHSEVSFTVRHMAVSKVRGRFGAVAGELVTAEDAAASTVRATIDVTSVTTFNEQRDAHLRTNDFFSAEEFPEAVFTSTGLTHDGEDFRLSGDLTLKGVTRPVVLTVEVSGLGPDAYGGTRIGFSATGRINRRDFGLEFDARLDNGGLVVANEVDLQLDVEAVLSA